MSAHTPGPWLCFYKHKYDEWHVSVPMPESSMRLALFDDGVRSENPEADARLIAAAPDLLAACKKMAEWEAREKDHAISFSVRLTLCDEAFSLMRAAIAAAEKGGTP